jgi:hypothetical protein
MDEYYNTSSILLLCIVKARTGTTVPHKNNFVDLLNHKYYLVRMQVLPVPRSTSPLDVHTVPTVLPVELGTENALVLCTAIVQDILCSWDIKHDSVAVLHLSVSHQYRIFHVEANGHLKRN